MTLPAVIRLLRLFTTVFFLKKKNRVGRITGRLPQELADQIVENVLELFRLEIFFYIEMDPEYFIYTLGFYIYCNKFNFFSIVI